MKKKRRAPGLAEIEEAISLFEYWPWAGMTRREEMVAILILDNLSMTPAEKIFWNLFTHISGTIKLR